MPKMLVITLCHEKTRKMKNAFCFDNCSCYNLRKNVSSSDFSFSQVTSVAKKEPRGTFLSLGLRPRLQKTFPRFPFFYFGNLGKTKIVRGQIFPQSSTTNYRNKILLIIDLGKRRGKKEIPQMERGKREKQKRSKAVCIKSNYITLKKIVFRINRVTSCCMVK